MEKETKEQKWYSARVLISAEAEIDLDDSSDAFLADSEKEAKELAIEIAEDQFNIGDFADRQYTVYLREVPDPDTIYSDVLRDSEEEYRRKEIEDGKRT